MTGKRFRKVIRQLLLIFHILNKNKYFQLILKKSTLNCEKKNRFLMSIEEKEVWYYLAVKYLSSFL